MFRVSTYPWLQWDQRSAALSHRGAVRSGWGPLALWISPKTEQKSDLKCGSQGQKCLPCLDTSRGSTLQQYLTNFDSAPLSYQVCSINWVTLGSTHTGLSYSGIIAQWFMSVFTTPVIKAYVSWM